MLFSTSSSVGRQGTLYGVNRVFFSIFGAFVTPADELSEWELDII